ncbi:hypothetical protein N7474_009546 [Penicillium riverlandense]|uniref:uncharacterized protein n=1 Tax=Penicillium riverlandense TaxID=1903569 RepID=UPI0025484D5E|nr:uncharacterized protein N7474_009546 [Penicillium riverlandense]KAJ5808277.1 hypothetical protein N7474_009546 [Penicillium riverlandense]
MSDSLYDGTIGTVKCAMETLAHLLRKAEESPNADSLLAARLYDDMKPFTFQVYVATLMAERTAARLAGRETTVFEDNLASYAEMHQRIDKVLKSLTAVDKDNYNKHADQVKPTQLPLGVEVDLSGAAYAHGMTVPNIFFHLNMVYAILRKEGVPLGKRDYLMPFLTTLTPYPVNKSGP